MTNPRSSNATVITRYIGIPGVLCLAELRIVGDQIEYKSVGAEADERLWMAARALAQRLRREPHATEADLDAFAAQEPNEVTLMRAWPTTREQEHAPRSSEASAVETKHTCPDGKPYWQECAECMRIFAEVYMQPEPCSQEAPRAPETYVLKEDATHLYWMNGDGQSENCWSYLQRHARRFTSRDEALAMKKTVGGCHLVRIGGAPTTIQEAPNRLEMKCPKCMATMGDHLIPDSGETLCPHMVYDAHRSDKALSDLERAELEAYRTQRELLGDAAELSAKVQALEARLGTAPPAREEHGEWVLRSSPTWGGKWRAMGPLRETKQEARRDLERGETRILPPEPKNNPMPVCKSETPCGYQAAPPLDYPRIDDARRLVALLRDRTAKNCEPYDDWSRGYKEGRDDAAYELEAALRTDSVTTPTKEGGK